MEERKAAKGHWIGVGAILAIAWLFLLVGVLGVYLHRSVYNEGVFAKRVAAVLEEPAVQTAMATEIADAVVKEVPEAVIARPIIQSAAQTLIAEPAFEGLVVDALVRFHQLLLNPEVSTLVFQVEGLPQKLEQLIAPYEKDLAVQVAKAADTQIAKIQGAGTAFEIIRIGADLGPVAWVIAFLGLGLLALAALIAPDRRRGIVAALVTLVAVGLGIVFVLGLARIGLVTLTAQDPVLSEAAGGIFDALLGDLRRTGYVIAAIGVIAAAVLWSLRYTAPVAAAVGSRAADGAGELGGRAVAAGAALGHREVHARDLTDAFLGAVRRLLRPAETTRGLLLQGAIALVIAAAILFAWSTVVDVIVLALGLGLLALALNRVLMLIVRRREAAGSGDGTSAPADATPAADA